MWKQDLARHGGIAASGSAVARVVYASQSNVEGSVYAEMERIRASAVRHNEPLGVCTALLHQAGWFVQWKEGPGDALLRLMDRVAADPRHHSMRIVHSSRGPRLLSGPWSMAIVRSSEDPARMAHRVHQARLAMDQGRQFAPPAVWRQLSTPMLHPGAARQADPDAFQRVLVCASAGSASFDLVRWIGRRTQQEVVHRRFAGARDLDVGTDLVDFAEEHGVMRMIAMARKGLAVPLARAFLQEYSHVMLMLCGDPSRDRVLAELVAEVCDELVSPPLLLGVAENPAAHAEPLAIAHERGLIYQSCLADPHHCATAWAAARPLLAQWRQAANSAAPVEPARRQPG